MTTDPDEIRNAVRARYGSRAAAARARSQASAPSAGLEPSIEGMARPADLGYAPEDLEGVPEDAELGLGCGNPLALLGLKPGERVLDLGSGGGIDCFIAAKHVGPSGRVIGIDMTPEMIGLARANAVAAGADNVEFRLGEIEHLPVDDASVDVIISNCVINLVPDKARAFAEAFRVLAPGGRLSVSDVVTTGDTPSALRGSMKAYTACLAGAIPREEYLGLIKTAGFTGVEVTSERTWPYFRGYASVRVAARRPADGDPSGLS